MSGMRTIRIAGEGISVDLLIWREYRRPMPGLIEAVLDSNPGLAALGPILPVGTLVKLPLLKPAPVAELAVARLWT